MAICEHTSSEGGCRLRYWSLLCHSNELSNELINGISGDNVQASEMQHGVFRRLTVPGKLGQSGLSWFFNLPPIIASHLTDEWLDRISQDCKTYILTW
jgi:hypothetical protein